MQELKQLKGFDIYIISPSSIENTTSFAAECALAVQRYLAVCNIFAFQLRIKDNNGNIDYLKTTKTAIAIKDVLHQFNIPLILNDIGNNKESLAMLNDIKPDGIHLGKKEYLSFLGYQSDYQSLTNKDVQTICNNISSFTNNKLSNQKIIGISCYNSAHVAQKFAQETCVTYVSFGAIFPTSTKQDTVPCQHGIVKEFKTSHPNTKVCVIGGINRQNIGTAKANTLADYYAMCQEIWAK